MTDAERQRLAAILGMLGSDHAGERAAAALQAEAFRRKHGLTWPELLALPTASHEPEPQPQWTPSPPPPKESATSPPWTYGGDAPRWIDWKGLLVPASYVALVAAPVTIAWLVRLFN
jgi:hypothetical protein